MRGIIRNNISHLRNIFSFGVFRRAAHVDPLEGFALQTSQNIFAQMKSEAFSMEGIQPISGIAANITWGALIWPRRDAPKF